MARLREAAAEQLLVSAAGRPADPAVSARLVAETGGNPLALVEVAQELTTAQLAGDAPLPEPVPLGRALEQLYRRETRALPPDTQMLLLAAATCDIGDPDLLWRAGTELGFDARAAGAAEDRQLLVVREVVRFRTR